MTSSIKDQIKAAQALWATDSSACMAAFHAIAPESPTEKLAYWRTFVVYNEWFERICRGLMPYHCSDMSELGFHFTDLNHYWDAAQKAKAPMDQAMCLLAAGWRLEAEPLFRIFENQGHVAGSVRFNPGYIAALEAIDPVIDLPAVEYHREPRIDSGVREPIVYLACDVGYLAFAVPMIRSMYAIAPGIAAQLHIFTTDGVMPKEIAEEFPGLGISTEKCPGADARYFHAIRFIRLHEFMARHNRLLWLMDVDAIFNQHPQALFDTLTDHDVAMRARPGRIEPWNQLNACVVGFNATAGGIAYLRRTAQFIHDARRRLAWGIDQQAMFCTMDDKQFRVACLAERMIDYDYTHEGIIWANSSNQKLAHLKAIRDPSVPIERPAYYAKFRAFAVPAHP